MDIGKHWKTIFDNLPAEDLIDKVDRKWSVGVNYVF